MTAARLQSVLRITHRWIGLTLGVILALIGVSGTSLLFQPQFFRWAHGEMIPENLPQQVGSIEQWARNARAVVPELHGPIVMWPPHTDHNVSDAGMLIFDGPEPGGIGNLGLKAVLVAPATGEVLGVVDVDRSPAYAPLFLHGSLLAGESGMIVVGIVAIGTLIMLPIGLYLWWPRQARQLTQKLSPLPLKRTFGYAARLHDWLGIWALVLLLVLAGTGLYMTQPSWVEPALNLLPAARHSEHSAATAPCSGAITLDAAIGKAQGQLPHAQLATVILEDDKGTYELVFRPRGSESTTGETHVLADLTCGSVVIEESPDTRAPKDVVTSWLSSLHDGTVFGWTGRILITIAGLTPLILAWSGIRVWLRRRSRRPPSGSASAERDDPSASTRRWLPQQ